MAANDFDFLLGRWSVQHTKLVHMFDPGRTDAIEFDTIAEVRSILTGLGTCDETSGPLPDGRQFCGLSLRLYDPGSDEWRIWWASTSQPGVLDPPVHGRFANGVGTFIGSTKHDDTTYLARFRWLSTTSDHPVWQQDFSFDEGQSWSPINWTMVHTHCPGRDAPATPARAGRRMALIVSWDSATPTAHWRSTDPS